MNVDLTPIEIGITLSALDCLMSRYAQYADDCDGIVSEFLTDTPEYWQRRIAETHTILDKFMALLKPAPQSHNGQETK